MQKIIPTTSVRGPAGDAPATKGFIFLAIGFYLMSGFSSPQSPIFQSLAQANSLVAAGEWWRIFTVVLLHGSLYHIGFNMWALWVLGPQVEKGVGTWPFVSLFLASSGVGGVTAFYLGGPFDVGVGASGAIFGLFGVWLNWALHRRNTLWGRALLGQLGFLLLINAAIPFFIPRISWQAHLGGLVAGFIIGEIWSRIRGPNAIQVRTAVGFAVAVLAVLAVLA